MSNNETARAERTPFRAAAAVFTPPAEACQTLYRNRIVTFVNNWRGPAGAFPPVRAATRQLFTFANEMNPL
jgi:hypothetical protein